MINMTIIASYVYANIPILFGDILITTSGRARAIFEPITNPVQGNHFTEFAESFQHIASGLVQKLTIISDELVVASAGSVYETNLIIRKLHELLKKPISVEILKNFFSKLNIKSITTENVNLIAYYIKPPEIKLHCFIYRAHTKDLRTFAQFKYVAYAGSASSLFFEAITDVDTRIPVLCPVYVDDEIRVVNFKGVPPALKSKYMTQHLLMWMLLQDYTTDFRSFKERCGQGYEMVWYVERNFQKTSDYSIVIWLYFSQKEKFAVRAVIKPFYKDNYLYIRYIDFNEKGVERDDTFEVKPLEKYDYETERSNIKPEVEGRFLCNYIVILSDDNTIKEIKPCIIINPDNFPLISLENDQLNITEKLYSFIKKETVK